MSQSNNGPPTVLKYRTDFEKSVVVNNFENRGWVRTTDGKLRMVDSDLKLNDRE